MPINPRHVYLLQQALLKYAERLDMREWYQHHLEHGATLCLGGMTVFLAAHGEVPRSALEAEDFHDLGLQFWEAVDIVCAALPEGAPTRAARAAGGWLGLNRARWVFHLKEWPSVFRQLYERCENPVGRAAVVCVLLECLVRYGEGADYESAMLADNFSLSKMTGQFMGMAQEVRGGK